MGSLKCLWLKQRVSLSVCVQHSLTGQKLCVVIQRTTSCIRAEVMSYPHRVFLRDRVVRLIIQLEFRVELLHTEVVWASNNNTTQTPLWWGFNWKEAQWQSPSMPWEFIFLSWPRNTTVSFQKCWLKKEGLLSASHSTQTQWVLMDGWVNG